MNFSPDTKGFKSTMMKGIENYNYKSKKRKKIGPSKKKPFKNSDHKQV